MKEPKSKFTTMGTSAASTARNASAESTGGKLVAKKNTQSGDPVIKDKANKSAGAKLGGRAYGITAKMPAYKSTEAGKVQGNGRLFKPAINRTAPNFRDGIQDHD
jgi:hypothetical protein